MSEVTNVILTFSLIEENNKNEALAEINDYLIDKHYPPFVVLDDINNDLSPFIAGNKWLEAQICIGAFNHLNIPEFEQVIKMASWIYPEDVKVLLQTQDSNTFVCYQIVE